MIVKGINEELDLAKLAVNVGVVYGYYLSYSDRNRKRMVPV